MNAHPAEHPVCPGTALADLWRAASMPEASLHRAVLTGTEPVLPSSFAVGTAAQVSIMAAALAASQVGEMRNGLSQQVTVDMREAALECCGYFTLDGAAPVVWDKIAGLYACRSGAVRIHTNFAHHRDGVLRLLGLPQGDVTERPAVATALAGWDALAFEQAATDAGLVVAALRTFDEWDHHPQATAIAAQPVVAIEKIGDAAPLDWPSLPKADRPLTALRVLDLTRILAGPVCGRALASFGADVMLVNSPHLPNIDAIADTSRGKLSAHADLRTRQGRGELEAALGDAHLFIQGYRPGGLDALGFGVEELARRRPGIVAVSLTAYGHTGPWAGKRGFDSLVQAATGFNRAEAEAAGESQPRPMPMQILDMASGALMAFGALAALTRQRQEGGSWHVRVSLARTGSWLRQIGRLNDGFNAPQADFSGVLETSVSSWGMLSAVRPSARFSKTPAGYIRPSMRPGSHPLAWPDI